MCVCVHVWCVRERERQTDRDKEKTDRYTDRLRQIEADAKPF